MANKVDFCLNRSVSTSQLSNFHQITTFYLLPHSKRTKYHSTQKKIYGSQIKIAGLHGISLDTTKVSLEQENCRGYLQHLHRQQRMAAQALSLFTPSLNHTADENRLKEAACQVSVLGTCGQQ